MAVGSFPLGDQRSAIASIDGNSYADVSRFGQLITGGRRDDILVRFEYNNATDDVGSPVVTGTGVASNSNSQAVVSTGAGIGSCYLETVGIMAYRPAHEMYSFGSLVFTQGEADTTQEWGPHDDDDGFIFGYSGSVFGVTIRKATVDTFTPQSSWNRDKCDGTGSSKFNLDPTMNNQYKITYGWLGIAPIAYYVYGGETIGWILCHVTDLTNVQTTPSTDSPNFKIRWKVDRAVGAGEITLAVGCVAGGSTQSFHTHAGHRVFAGRIPATIAAGTTHIGTFRNKSTYQGKTNKIDVEASFAGFSTEGNKPVEFLFYKNAALVGMVWNDIDTVNSVVDVSAVGTATGGKFELSVPLARAEGQAIDLGAGHVHLELHPGETMSILTVATSNSDVVASFRWEEYFA